MTADIEDNYIVAQANEPLDENGHFVNKKVTARYRAEIIQVDASKVDYMDVSPKMVVSVATAMIPFLENDDNSPRPYGVEHAEAGGAAYGDGISYCRNRYGIQSRC